MSVGRFTNRVTGVRVIVPEEKAARMGADWEPEVKPEPKRRGKKNETKSVESD